MELVETIVLQEIIIEVEPSQYSYMVTFHQGFGYRVHRRLKDIGTRDRRAVKIPYWNRVSTEAFTVSGIFEPAGWAKPVHWFVSMEDAREFVQNEVITESINMDESQESNDG